MKLKIKIWYILLYYCILLIGLTTSIKINDKVLFCGEDYTTSSIFLLLGLLPHLWILIELIIKLKK